MARTRSSPSLGCSNRFFYIPSDVKHHAPSLYAIRSIDLDCCGRSVLTVVVGGKEGLRCM